MRTPVVVDCDSAGIASAARAAKLIFMVITVDGCGDVKQRGEPEVRYSECESAFADT